jgi:hypothetical protein
MAGLPLFLAAVDLPGVSAEAGLVLLALAGVAIAACGVAGTALDPGGPAVGTPDAAALTILAGGGGIGSVLAVAACPLAWISFGDVELGGLDGGVGAGGWLIPLALAVAAGCGLTAAVARTGDARRVVPVAAGSTALAAAAATFATTAAIVFRGYRMETGLSLVLAGTAIAVVSTGFGTAALCLRGPAPRDAAGAEMPGADQRW